MTPEERFWPKVRKTDGCWLWQGARTAPGWHGVFAIDASRDNRTMVVAHRFAWEQTHGPIPAGLKVCHSCDEPACVRPDHLFLGTQRANMTDAARKGRLGTAKAWTACRKGHPFTEDNTYRSPKTGRRQCRVCRDAAGRRSRSNPEYAARHRERERARYHRRYAHVAGSSDRDAAEALGRMIG